MQSRIAIEPGERDDDHDRAKVDAEGTKLRKFIEGATSPTAKPPSRRPCRGSLPHCPGRSAEPHTKARMNRAGVVTIQRSARAAAASSVLTVETSTAFVAPAAEAVRSRRRWQRRECRPHGRTALHARRARASLAPKELGADEDGAHLRRAGTRTSRPVTRWVEAEAAGERSRSDEGNGSVREPDECEGDPRIVAGRHFGPPGSLSSDRWRSLRTCSS